MPADDNAPSPTSTDPATTNLAGPAAEYSPAQPWQDMLDEATRYFQDYNDRCDNIDKLYGDLKALAAGATDREFQIFWANMEVMRPSVYSRSPIPVVVPAFRDRRELPTKASEFLERAMVTAFRVNGGIHNRLVHVRDDLCQNARGVIWVRYVTDDAGERIEFDWLDRSDFLHEPARAWEEVGWCARRDWLTRDQMRARFEPTSGETWQLAKFKERRAEGTKDGGLTSEAKGEPKAAVWTIWHKVKRQVAWVSPGVQVMLDVRDPFLTLEEFFPCPRPAYATVQRRTLIPIPDFLYYKDQVEEINELTARIASLTESLRLRGFYPGGASDVAGAIQKALDETDNRQVLIAVPNFASLGGSSLEQSIVWLPLDKIASAIRECVELRRVLIEDVYQITGLSDILRGETDPNETLGAQELKAQTGSGRMKLKQEEMVRLALDASRLAGEIIAENFKPETLVQMAQSDLPTDQVIQQQTQQQIAGLDAKVQQAQSDPRVVQLAQRNPQLAQQALARVAAQKQQIQQQAQQTVTTEKVIGLLRDQKMRPFTIDIETDSTIQPDESAEKQQRTEFVTTVGTFLGAAVPLIQQVPQAGPLVGETLKFLASGFRAGRELEGVIDDFADQIEQMAQQPKPPDPAVVKAQADAQSKQQDMQMRQADGQQKMQQAVMDMRMQQDAHAAEMRKSQAELQKAMLDLVAKFAEIQAQRDAQANAATEEAA